MNDVKPWYLSRTVWGSAISLLAAVLSMFGIILTPDVVAGLTENLLILATAIGSLVALWGRVSATKRIGK